MLELYPGRRLVYHYALGDDWHPYVYLKAVAETDREPYCEALLNVVGGDDFDAHPFNRRASNSTLMRITLSSLAKYTSLRPCSPTDLYTVWFNERLRFGEGVQATACSNGDSYCPR